MGDKDSASPQEERDAVKSPRAELVVTSAAIVGGASLAYTIGKDLIPHIKGKEEFLLTFLKAKSSKNYILHIEITSLSLNTAYVTNIKFVDPNVPAHLHCKAASGVFDTATLGASRASKRARPVLEMPIELLPQSKMYIECELLVSGSKDFYDRSYGGIEITIVPVDNSQEIKDIVAEYRILSP